MAKKKQINFKVIKSFNKDQMARFLFRVETGSVIPKYYNCNEISCADCKENLKCYKNWLNSIDGDNVLMFRNKRQKLKIYTRAWIDKYIKRKECEPVKAITCGKCIYEWDYLKHRYKRDKRDENNNK